MSRSSTRLSVGILVGTICCLSGMTAAVMADVTLSKELAESVIGHWQGSSPSPSAGEDGLEICFKPDGTVSGEVQSVRGGYITFVGTYKQTDGGDGVVTQQTYRTGPRAVLGRGSSFTLRPAGNGTLEGTGTSDTRAGSFPVRYTKRTKTSC